MKLLLTSEGITNKSIARALLDLTGLPAKKIKVVFVYTAANIETGDKGWVIDNLLRLKQQGYKSIDILDIAAVPQKIWEARLKAANVLYFNGGNTQYLASVMQKSGLAKALPALLKTRVYVGGSAGSMVTGHFVMRELLRVIYGPEDIPKKLEKSLKLVDLTFIPHLNSKHFPRSRKKIIRGFANKKLPVPIYALDDQSALKIVNGKIEVVSEGEYLKI